MSEPTSITFVVDLLGGEATLPEQSYPQAMTKQGDGSWLGDVANGGSITITDEGTYWQAIQAMQGAETVIWRSTSYPAYPPLHKSLWFIQAYSGSAGNPITDIQMSPKTELLYHYSSNTSMGSGPAFGSMKLNSTNLTGVTLMNVNTDQDADGHDTTTEVESWASAGTLEIRHLTDSSKHAIYTVGTVTDPQTSNYRQVALTYVSGTGTLADSSLVTLEFTPA